MTGPTVTTLANLELDEESGTIAAAEGIGGTTAENAAAAAIEGSADTIGVLGRVGQVGEVLSTVQLGLTVGKGVASFACSEGIADECYPQPVNDPDFDPNIDVVAVDPGWVVGDGTGWVQYYGVGSGKALCNGSAGSVTGATFVAAAGLQAGASASQTVLFEGAGPAVSGQCPRLGGVAGSSSACYLHGASGCSVVLYDASGALMGSGLSADPTGDGVTLALIDSLSTVPGVVIFCGSTVAWCGLWSGSGQAPALTSAAVSSLPAGSTVYAEPGSSFRGPAVPADPLRTLQTVVTCSDSSGNPVAQYGAESAEFHETDSDWPPYPMPTQQCPTGSAMSSVVVTEVTQGLPNKTIWSVTIPAEVQQATVGGACSSGACKLDLSRVGTSDDPTQTTGDCFAQSGRCQTWTTDPDKSTDFQCTYGGTVVDLSECQVYAPTFDPAETAKGVDYADPATGTVPDTIPVTEGDTGTGGSTSGSTGITVDPSGSGCWPSGWSAFNPLEWVLDPVECALEWAFVPDAGQWATATSGFESAFQGSPVYAWWTAISGDLSSISGTADSCSAWTATYPLPTEVGGGSDSMTVLNPCSGAMATIASLSRAISTVLLVVFGALACIRGILTTGFGIPLRLGSAPAELGDS